MARNPVMIKDPRLEEAALRAAVAAHQEEVNRSKDLERRLAETGKAHQESLETVRNLGKAEEEAEQRKREAMLAAALKEEALAKAAKAEEEVEKIAKEIEESQKLANESGQLVASAYDERESALLYGRIAEAIASVPNLHPHIILFALDMARDTVMRKARKRYSIPG